MRLQDKLGAAAGCASSPVHMPAESGMQQQGNRAPERILCHSQPVSAASSAFKKKTVVKRQRLVGTLGTGCQLLVSTRQATERYAAVETHITDRIFAPLQAPREARSSGRLRIQPHAHAGRVRYAATGPPNPSGVIHGLSRQPAAVFKNNTAVARQRLVKKLSTGCQLLVLARERYTAVGTHITDLDLSVTRRSTVH
jgi:hypothetical protein